jgi:hypothetical protein
MVMAAEPGKSGSEQEKNSNLSIPSKKTVPNIKICTKSIPAENRNGQMALPKLASSVGNNKHEENLRMDVDTVSQNGQMHSRVKEKFISEDDSSNNNLKSDVSPSHRDQLLLLHLDLIEQQQQLIQEKDREILELKNEKEQVWQWFVNSMYFVMKIWHLLEYLNAFGDFYTAVTSPLFCRSAVCFN